MANQFTITAHNLLFIIASYYQIEINLWEILLLCITNPAFDFLL